MRAEVHVAVPSTYDSRGYWRWVPADKPFAPLGEETVLSRRELELVVIRYGEFMAATYHASGPMRYRIQAWDIHQQRVCALHTWVWSSAIARYLPYDVPWVVWA